MIVAGRDFNFGRCIKIEFYKGNSLALTVEHKPDVDPNYYIAMDVEVTDMPSPLAHDKPGFQGTVTIYNPSRQVLTTIASGATWLSDFVNSETQKMIANTAETIEEGKRGIGMKEYYASRLRAIIYAGYVVKGVPNYTRILGGYVNGSSFSHKGTDDILKIGIYDIDMTEVSTSMLNQEEEDAVLNKSGYRGFVVESKWTDKAKTKFANTWHETFIKYVKNFETEWIEDTHGINIIYVKSLRAWMNSRSKTRVGESALNPTLERKLKAQKMPNGGISAFNLASMLNGLCAAAEVKCDWRRITEDVSINTYIIFPLGDGYTIVRGQNANIQIWNYQNLLETPSIDGAGKMTIKMVFNPQCVCNKTIALMLTSSLGETDVTRNIASFESSVVKGGGIIGSMSSTGNDAAVANNQITGNTNVQSQRKQARDANQTGYLFNTGFPIIKVEHTLSTYGPNWTTTVKTVPITAGLKFEGKK